ncbi:MAG: membrane dipeptidase, partial [Lachnospiraceae bacterium]|nr:membrane dipeptidase [Lachnospiraceae bacterium]
ILYQLGVRMMTLTWNFKNELGWPNGRMETDPGNMISVPDTEHGLTETGIAFLAEMERLGMIIDISHLNDGGIWDVFRHTAKPFVASHSNCRALASHPRNLTDDMIRALGERGGVAGINFCAAFLRDEKPEATVSYINDMIRHMKHMKQVGGIGVIGLGTDFDGIKSQVEVKDASQMQLLAQAMEKEGFTAGEIDQVFHGNVLRVYKEILR